MLKTSELLQRFNNPNLIQQDIDNLCQYKLAEIVDSGKLKPALEELAKHEETLKQWANQKEQKKTEIYTR